MAKFSLEQVNDMYFDVLKELGNIGAGNATTAISNMLDLKVDMKVPKVQFLDFQELPTAISAEEDTVAGIYLEVETDIGGSMMFLLKMESAHYLVNRLMGRPTEYMQEFDDQGSSDKIREVPLEEKEIHKFMRYRNPLNHVTVMFRKEAVMSAGNYQHFPFLEDYYLWNRMYAGGAKLANIPKVLVKVRTSPNMFKRRGGFSYCAGYLRFRRIQRKLNITNTREYLLGCILSIAITLQPGWLRKWVYSAVLRRSGDLEENG